VAVALFVAYFAPIVWKLKDGALIAVIVIGLVLMNRDSGTLSRTRTTDGGRSPFRPGFSGYFFPLNAAHTRAGVKGMSRWLMPSGLSASIAALTSAGNEPLQPDSPTPFAPSALVGVGTG
jgi:hypothetical protein